MVISGASKSSLPEYKVSWTQGEYEDMSCLIENNSDDIEVQATAPPTQQPQTLPPVTVAEEADPKDRCSMLLGPDSDRTVPVRGSLVTKHLNIW